MNIKRINTCTIQKIGSSQAVVTLAAAIKELIENSLDANSNKIEIRLKNFGADLIEVFDDGRGILSNEFHEFTKRHTTSKLENFEDLNNLEYFGFRGEALNSLCCLGDVQIHTRSECNDVGTLLSFDQLGNITNSSCLARQRGTTVSVRNIFHSLPVRRKQFIANLKREFDRAIKYITSYCLMSVNVHISCYKNDKNKQLVVSTNGSRGISGNIESVYGVNQLKSMAEVITERNVSQDILEEFNVKDLSYLGEINLSGWISKPMGNLSASNAGKQFIYINGRPCESPRIKSVILECYRIMNKSNIPAFVLNITLPKGNIDINIEPDKRLLLLNKQLDVLAVVKASILTCFSACGFSPETRILDRSLDETMNFSFNHPSPLLSTDSINKDSSAYRSESKRRRSSPEIKNSKLPKSSQIEIRSIALENREARLPQVSCKHIQTSFSMGLLIEACNNLSNNPSETTLENYRFHITANENKQAAHELKRIFRKQYFNDLSVIGQFNKGFIIARKNDDLFIIDQHASDEKNQFEKLCESCTVTSQPLVCPQRLLHITAGDEEIIKEQLDTFEKWGFRFDFKTAEQVHNRVFLSATSCRNSLVLGSEDIHEMIQFMKECGNYRFIMPSKIKVAIASNACRSAIMIGTCLSLTEMEQILRNMALMKDPWTCAHGRPTMRHLYCLD